MKFFDDLSSSQAKFLNPLSLAFVGDAVFTLYARERVTVQSDATAAALHRKATAIVKAQGQAQLADELLPLLTEEEAGVFRRAKNSKHHSVAKNASSEEYNKATGLEAVLGFLYLTGQEGRIKQLLKTEE